MSKYYECPTANYECPYWDWKEYKCAMEIIDGDSPAGQCDEYDAFNDEEEEDEVDESLKDGEHVVNSHESCGNRALQKTCEKATHIENYHIDSGCSDFTPEEAGGKICEARKLLVRALDQLYLLGYDSGFTNPVIEGLITDIKNFLRGE